jgi:hypothetical protein
LLQNGFFDSAPLLCADDTGRGMAKDHEKCAAKSVYPMARREDGEMMPTATPSSDSSGTRRCKRAGDGLTGLPPDMAAALRKLFSPARAGYIASVLSADQIRVIQDLDLGDALILARIEAMKPGRLGRFDHFVPKNSAEQRRFNEAQKIWMDKELRLLTDRLGHQPSLPEWQDDFKKHRNGPRFRAYYVLKYPDRMKPW